ncbi:MAG: pyridoxal phosphate-dependent aminotransferase [Ktedonobacterales bacterium]
MVITESDRSTSLVRMTMADMAELADQRPDAIRLENADAYLAPAPHVVQATRDAVGIDRYNSYLPLQGLLELRQAISDRYEADYGLRYDPEGEVVVTCGTGEAMLDVLLSYVNPGDGVLLTNPTYNGMAQRVRLAQGVQIFTNLVEQSGWRLDVASVRERAAGCKVVFYAAPCMPTGTVFTDEETAALADAARANDALVVFNGVVDKIVFDGRRVIHPATLPGMRERTITVGAVSKNYNMMCWRIGWALGPRELLRPIHDVHIFNGIMPSGFAQAGASAALAGPQDDVAASIAVYQHNRDILVQGLAAIPGLQIHSPEGGYFFIANIGALGVTSREFCERLLEEENVATTPMIAWGSDDFGNEHVRFIFTNEPEQRLHEAIQRIAAFVQRHYD